MGRLIMGVVAIAIMGYLGYRTMYRGAAAATADAEGQSAPKRRLENVQKAADRIEKQDQDRADKALQGTEGQ